MVARLCTRYNGIFWVAARCGRGGRGMTGATPLPDVGGDFPCHARLRVRCNVRSASQHMCEGAVEMGHLVHLLACWTPVVGPGRLV